MKNILQHYFGFSKRQMNGFWVLALLSQALLAWTFYVHPVNNYTPEDRARDLLLLDSMKKEWAQQRFKKVNSQKYTNKQASYHYKKNQYRKPAYTPSKKTFKKKKEVKPFDISLADTTQLKQIRGIGSKLSLRIITFRDKLGGFYSLEQIREVYGLAPEVQEKLMKFAFLGKSAVKKLFINQATEEVLRKHPYISYKLAKVLVNYRKQHGHYHTVADLGKIYLLDDEGLKKLLPYIDFEIL